MLLGITGQGLDELRQTIERPFSLHDDVSSYEQCSCDLRTTLQDAFPDSLISCSSDKLDCNMAADQESNADNITWLVSRTAFCRPDAAAEDAFSVACRDLFDSLRAPSCSLTRDASPDKALAYVRNDNAGYSDWAHFNFLRAELLGGHSKPVHHLAVRLHKFLQKRLHRLGAFAKRRAGFDRELCIRVEDSSFAV